MDCMESGESAKNHRPDCGEERRGRMCVKAEGTGGSLDEAWLIDLLSKLSLVPKETILHASNTGSRASVQWGHGLGNEQVPRYFFLI